MGERAYHVCEYRLIHEDDTFWGCQVDHIISPKHGGASARNASLPMHVIAGRLQVPEVMAADQERLGATADGMAEEFMPVIPAEGPTAQPPAQPQLSSGVSSTKRK